MDSRLTPTTPKENTLKLPIYISGDKLMKERQRKVLVANLQLAITAAAEAEVRIIFLMDQLKEQGMQLRDCKEVANFMKQRLKSAQDLMCLVKEGL